MPWDFANDRPIYLQLMEHIRHKIISGEYQAGDKLPSVRDLAAEAAVNPNTMQKALGELERTGIIYTMRTSGRYVTEDGAMLKELRKEIALAKTEEFLQGMAAFGFDLTDTEEILAEVIRQRQGRDS